MGILNRPAILMFFLLSVVAMVYDSYFLKIPDHVIDAQKWQAIIVQNPTINEYGQTFLAQIDKIGSIKITLNPPNDSLKLHDEIEFDSKLTLINSYKNPGCFDFKRFMARRGVLYQAYIDTEKNPIRIVSTSAVPKKQIFYKSTENKLNELKISDENKSIMKALLWGDESELEQDTKELFRTMGLYHLLVISGLHFAALIFCVYFIVSRLLSVRPDVYLHVPGKQIAAFVSLLIVSFYYWLCIPGPSVTRAYLTAVIISLSILFRRQLDFLNLVFFVACLMVMSDLSVVFDVSFQFSFVAVLSLVLIYPKLNNYCIIKNKNLFFRCVGHLRTLLLATVSIFIGLTPLSVFYFHQFQLSGFVMNLWAVPVLEFLITPVLIAGFFIAPVFPFLAGTLYLFSDSCLTLSLRLMRFFSKYLPSDIKIFSPHIWELLLYYSVVFIFISQIEFKLKKKLFLLALTIFIFVNGGIYLDSIYHQDIRYFQIDVGQGDATVLSLPGNIKVMIDTGGSNYTDIANKAVLPFFDYQRWTHLDALFLSHDDTDHIGAAKNLLDNINVDKIYWNGRLPYSETLKELIAHYQLEIMPKNLSYKNCRVEDLMSEHHQEFKNDNDSSLLLKWVCPDANILLTGDASSEVEYQLLKNDESKISADIFKLAHHGSKTSNSIQFLKAVGPQVATVSSKKENHFGHPSLVVLERLKDLNIPILRTDEDGLIELSVKNHQVKKVNY